MYKCFSGVMPSAIRGGLLVVCLAIFSTVNVAAILTQEPPPQTDAQLQARKMLNDGVQAYKNAQYDEAVEDFLRAKQLDPKMINARLYLATAYASQYIPGAPSEANLALGRQAVEEFRDVLTIDPENLSAIDGIGSILFQLGGAPFDPEKFQESKTYHQMHIAVRPDDPEPYYWVGVIDWTITFRANAEIRQKYNQANINQQVPDTEPLPPAIRNEYFREYGPIIDEGIDSLKRAILLKPEYEDAMAYLNLLYRRKADTVAYENERDKLLEMADDLIDKVKEIKQTRAGQPNQP